MRHGIKLETTGPTLEELDTKIILLAEDLSFASLDAHLQAFI